MLRTNKVEGGLGDTTYKNYPTGTSSPKFYGLSKIHKKETSLEPYCPAGVQLLMGWSRSWLTSLDHW